MSLVDRVLRDLEERHAFVAMQPDSVLNDLRSAQDFARQRRIPELGAGLVVGVMAAGAIAVLLVGGAFPGMAPETAGERLGIADAGAQAPAAAPRMKNPQPARVDLPPTQSPPGLSLRLDMPVTLAAAAASDQAVVPVPAAESTHPKVRLSAINHRATALDADINLHFSEVPDYSLFVLENPDRLLVELNGAELAGDLQQQLAADGLLKGLRIAVQEPKARLVFDLTSPAVIESSAIHSEGSGGQRLQISLVSRGADPGALFDILPGMDATLEPQRNELPPAQPAMQRVARAPQAAGPGESAFRLGARAMQAGDPVTAIARLHEALQLDPSHLAARQRLVAVLAAEGDSSAARRVAAEGLSRHRGDPVLTKALAKLLLADGDASRALAALADYRPALRDDPDYFALQAAMLQQLGRHAEAAAVYENLVSQYPGNGLWWAGMGISLDSIGHDADALQAYRRASRDRAVPAAMQRHVTERIRALTGTGG
jgi:tetratricopeptide (TPR) repeat protein